MIGGFSQICQQDGTGSAREHDSVQLEECSIRNTSFVLAIYVLICTLLQRVMWSEAEGTRKAAVCWCISVLMRVEFGSISVQSSYTSHHPTTKVEHTRPQQHIYRGALLLNSTAGRASPARSSATLQSATCAVLNPVSQSCSGFMGFTG